MRMECTKRDSTALIIPSAPSVVTVVGGRSPLPVILRKNSLQQASDSDSLFPTARCNRCFRPSESMLFGPLTPERLEDGVAEEAPDGDVAEIASTEGLVVTPELVGDLRDGRAQDLQASQDGLDHVDGPPR